MDDDPEQPVDQGDGSEDGGPEQIEPLESGHRFGWSTPSLGAFAAIQRSLASIDFSAIRAAHRAFEQAGAVKRVIETQDAIAKNFARSIDFSGLSAAHKAIMDTGAASQAIAAQK